MNQWVCHESVWCKGARQDDVSINILHTQNVAYNVDMITIISSMCLQYSEIARWTLNTNQSINILPSVPLHNYVMECALVFLHS